MVKDPEKLFFKTDFKRKEHDCQRQDDTIGNHNGQVMFDYTVK